MRKLLIGIFLALCVSCQVKAESMQSFIGDGGISLNGRVDGAGSGEVVTLTVVRNRLDWLDYDTWLGNHEDDIVYYKESITEAGGLYSFDFSLNENGVYRYYVGSSALDEPQMGLIRFIHKEKNDDAIARLLSPEADIKEIITENRFELGLFDKIYEEADIESTSAILRPSLQTIDSIETDEMIVLIQKAMLASMLNEGKVKDIDLYTEYFKTSDAFNFYNKNFSNLLTAGMSEMDIKDVEHFDEMLTDNTILCSINQNDGIGTVRSVLDRYYERIGIPKSKITTALCIAVVNKRDFKTIEELQKFITDYKESADEKGGSSSGGIGRKNAYRGLEISYDVLEDSVTNEVLSVFDDIASVPWAKEAILKLYYLGVLNGKAENKFCPNDSIKREEFAKMITIALKIDLTDEEFPFKDIDKDDWSYPYVKTAYLAGITKGIASDIFGKGMNITRQDLCVMVYNALATGDIMLKERNAEFGFNDYDKIADYAKEAVKALQMAGIVAGDELGYFNPNNSATRAEAAKIVYLVISYKQ